MKSCTALRVPFCHFDTEPKKCIYFFLIFVFVHHIHYPNGLNLNFVYYNYIIDQLHILHKNINIFSNLTYLEGTLKVSYIFLEGISSGSMVLLLVDN